MSVEELSKCGMGIEYGLFNINYHLCNHGYIDAGIFTDFDFNTGNRTIKRKFLANTYYHEI